SGSDQHAHRIPLRRPSQFDSWASSRVAGGQLDNSDGWRPRHPRRKLLPDKKLWQNLRRQLPVKLSRSVPRRNAPNGTMPILVPLLSNDNTTVLVVNVNRPSVLAHAGPHLIPVVQNIELHVFRHAVLVRMSFY